jgi:hypothetical protein
LATAYDNATAETVFGLFKNEAVAAGSPCPLGHASGVGAACDGCLEPLFVEQRASADIPSALAGHAKGSDGRYFATAVTVAETPLRFPAPSNARTW